MFPAQVLEEGERIRGRAEKSRGKVEAQENGDSGLDWLVSHRKRQILKKRCTSQ